MYYNLPDKYFYPVVEKDDLEFEDNLFRSMDVEAGEEKEKREVLYSTEGNEVVEDNEVNVVSEREENGSNIDIKEEGVIEEPVGEMRGEEETEDSTEDSILEEADEEYSSSEQEETRSKDIIEDVEIVEDNEAEVIEISEEEEEKVVES